MEIIGFLIILFVIFFRLLQIVKSASEEKIIFPKDPGTEKIFQNESPSKIKTQNISTKNKFEEAETPKIEISYTKTISPSEESLELKTKKIQLTEKKLEEAIIYSIILGPPKSAIIFPKILGRDKQI